MKKILLSFAMLLALGFAATSCSNDNGNPGPNPPNPFPGPGPGNTSYVEIDGVKYTIPIGTSDFDAFYYEEIGDDLRFNIDYYQGDLNPSFDIKVGKNLLGQKINLAPGASIWSLAFYEYENEWGFSGNNQNVNEISDGIMRVTSLGNNRFRIEAVVTSIDDDVVKIYFEGKLPNLTEATVGTFLFNGVTHDIMNDGTLEVKDRGDFYTFEIYSGNEGNLEFDFSIDKDLMGQTITLEESDKWWNFDLSFEGWTFSQSNKDASGISTGTMKITSLGNDVFSIECSFMTTQGDEIVIEFESDMYVVQYQKAGTITINNVAYDIPRDETLRAVKYPDYYRFQINFSTMTTEPDFWFTIGEDLLGQTVPMVEGVNNWGINFNRYVDDNSVWSLEQDNENASLISSGTMKITPMAGRIYKIESALTTTNGDVVNVQFEGVMDYSDQSGN